ncbi:MAG: CBS domain-containing protein [Alphaproteobacteria bacterium]|nr:CBS domain-containing protein [Alphaproteobacteria bacterium]MDE2336796.1 CBS domain-containing protein [Alphaproteobacteria bacterium]
MPLLVKDLMWSAPPVISPDTTLKEAALKMTEVNAGVLPVGGNGKVEGIITDRDIVIRSVSQGQNPALTKVSEVMTRNIHFCRTADSIPSAAETMKKRKVGRLAVMDDKNRFCGILSFGHIFRNDASAAEAAEVILRVADRSHREKQLAVR